MSDTLNIVLFSGTADKLHAAATLAAGAAAMDRPVNILLQYWALDAFRTVRIEEIIVFFVNLSDSLCRHCVTDRVAAEDLIANPGSLSETWHTSHALLH